jgi:hypothetical protein
MMEFIWVVSCHMHEMCSTTEKQSLYVMTNIHAHRVDFRVGGAW